jgi:hypothetical protein
VDLIGLAQDRYRWSARVNAVMNIASGCATCGVSYEVRLV